jgi:hypothetical protein
VLSEISCGKILLQAFAFGRRIDGAWTGLKPARTGLRELFLSSAFWSGRRPVGPPSRRICGGVDETLIELVRLWLTCAVADGASDTLCARTRSAPIAAN